MSTNFWVLKFTHYPKVETYTEDGVTHTRGTTRDSYDKQMCLDESAEKIPAGTTVIINYKDSKDNAYEDHFELDPSIWIGYTFEENKS